MEGKGEGKEEKEEEKQQVEIVSRDIIDTYPKLRELHRQVAVTYRHELVGPRTVFIDLYELFKDKQDDAVAEITLRSGKLFEKYMQEERKRIKEDLERELGKKPETYTI